MTKWIVFQNEGEVDINALVTLGVNVKPKAQSIGHFGTGFKYALATIIRYGGEIIVQSAGKHYAFGGKNIEIRGKEFTLVCLCHEHQWRDLGFTTELGKDWETWQSFRELYCNALDENGSVGALEAEESAWPALEGDGTFIMVKGAGFDAIYRNMSRWFILPEDIPVGVTSYAEAYPAEGMDNHAIFYRGVNAGKFEKPSMFRWNIKQGMILTEDRTIKYPFMTIQAIRSAVVGGTLGRPMMEAIVCARDEFAESTIDFSEASEPSEEFMLMCRELRETSHKPYNISILDLMRKQGLSLGTFRPIAPPEADKNMLTECIELLKAAGFRVDDFPIHVVSTLGQNILGEAVERQIFLSTRAFAQGKRRLLGTILEEYLHLQYGFADYSLGMQDHLVDLCAQFIERGARKHEENSLKEPADEDFGL